MSDVPSKDADAGQPSPNWADLNDRLREVEEENRRLRDTMQRLLPADRRDAVSKLVEMIVHSIRSPLTAITGLAELLQMQEKTDERDQGLDSILTAAWRLSDTTDAIEKLCVEYRNEYTLIDVRSVGHQVVETLGPLTPPQVDIDMQPAPHELIVRSSQRSVSQILMNLLTNAFDALTPEGGRIEMELGLCGPAEDLPGDAWHTIYARPLDTSPDDTRFVFVEVRDNGRGIDAERLHHFFAPTFSMPPAETAGLGLTLGQSIVRQLGGNLRLSTLKGTGTRMRLLLPMVSEEPQLSRGGQR